MGILYINKNACSCCGHIIKRWANYPYTENEGSLCLKCHIQSLRAYAKQIAMSKMLIGNSLGPENKAKWDAMNSQEQKLVVFRYMEAGQITYKIGNKR